ncbi:MAG: RNA 2',3'-cyclic phosphodiesterase [Gemmatimonadales bacterium]
MPGRFFLAIPLPAEVRRRLSARVASVGGVDEAVRWVPEEQLHLTLKFLGDVTDDRLPDVAPALMDACQGAKPFPLDVMGFGSFPPARPPRVLWAGIEPAPSLELLQDKVERAMAAVEFPVEGQPFRPHVTVGRVKRGRSAGRTAERLAGAEHHDTFVAERVELMESILHATGARYAVRHTVTLAT